jgi:hypothetical protein
MSEMHERHMNSEVIGEACSNREERTATLAGGEQGAVGYILLWLMGVPASLLFVFFILRGCN